MKTLSIGIFAFVIFAQSYAQNATVEQEIKELSKTKWQWMADKNADSLAADRINKVLVVSRYFAPMHTPVKPPELQVMQCNFPLVVA